MTDADIEREIRERYAQCAAKGDRIEYLDISAAMADRRTLLRLLDASRYEIGVLEIGLLCISQRSDPVHVSIVEGCEEQDALRASNARLLEALKDVQHIGPLGVDTYPEVYRRIQAVVSAAIAGEGA